MDKWKLTITVLGAVGLVDSAYLVSDVLSPQVALYCPSTGLVNCIKLTQSPYSEFLGVRVAYLGLGWFAAVVVLALLYDWLPAEYTLLPLWALGAVFVSYLVFIEIFVLQAICSYCTIAHALALILGIPIVKLVLLSDT